jgi:hypothetical protein
LNHALDDDKLDRIKIPVIYVNSYSVWSSFGNKIGATDLG